MKDVRGRIASVLASSSTRATPTGVSHIVKSVEMIEMIDTLNRVETVEG